MIDGFENPKMLFLLLTVPPVLLFSLRQCFYLRKALSTVLITGSKSMFRMLLIRTVFFLCAWISLIFASASPFGGERFVSQRQEGSSVFFVMDISASMSVSDIVASRLIKSAEYVSVLTDYLIGIPCGVVLSKGSALLAIPLTRDRLVLRSLFDSLSPTLLTSAGSSLGKGVIKALESFPENSSAAKIIILCTDGDETDSFLLDAAKKVRASGATLIILGFGTEEGSLIDIIVPPGEPTTIRTALNSSLLERVSASAGGDSFYQNGSDIGSVHTVLELISSKHYATAAIAYTAIPLSHRQFFLFLALFFFSSGILVGALLWPK